MITTSVFHTMYDGDGVTTAFPFTFPYDNSDDIMVVLIDEDTTETVLTSDYYVNTVNNTVYYPGYAPGAEPPLADQPPVLAVGQKLMVYRKTPVTQIADLGEKWPFATIEGGLDKLTMILQETSYDVNCALRVSDATSMAAGDDLDLEIPIEAGKTLIGNSTGTGYETATALLKDGSVWDADGLKISNVADPVASTDVATKGYVDSIESASLPLTGGTMSGPIATTNNVLGKKTTTDGYLAIDGGTSNLTGARLTLRGADMSSNTGAFSLSATDGVNIVNLWGYPNGNLLWNGKSVALVDGDASSTVFSTVASLKASTALSAGQVVFTRGYRSSGDGGGAQYIVRSKTNSDTTNNYSLLQLGTSALVAELCCPDGTINVKQCGAYGDGTHDDKTYIDYAIASGYKTIVFPPGTYATAGRITVKEGIHLIGCGATLLKTDNSSSFLELGYSNITVEGFKITQNTNRASGTTTSLVLIHSTAGANISHIRVTNCVICDAAMYGVNIQDSSYYVRDVKVDHCHIYNVNVGVKNGGGYTRDVVIDSCNIHYTLGECVTFDGTVQFSSLSNSMLYSNDGGVGLVGCDHSSYITITGNRFSQVGSSGTATLLRGITFNRHMGICNGYVVNGNVFVNCYYGVYCKQAETEGEHTWTSNGVKNLVCTDNVFINSVAGDIRIDNIEGDNDFRCNVSTDRSKLYVLLSAHEAEIRAKSRFDS